MTILTFNNAHFLQIFIAFKKKKFHLNSYFIHKFNYRDCHFKLFVSTSQVIFGDSCPTRFLFWIVTEARITLNNSVFDSINSFLLVRVPKSFDYLRTQKQGNKGIK